MCVVTEHPVPSPYSPALLYRTDFPTRAFPLDKDSISGRPEVLLAEVLGGSLI